MGFIGLILFTLFILAASILRAVYYAVVAFFTHYKIVIQPKEQSGYLPGVPA